MKKYFSSLGPFLSGMAIIFGSFALETPRQPGWYERKFGTDAELIASDWQVVGDDIRIAIENKAKQGGQNDPE